MDLYQHLNPEDVRRNDLVLGQVIPRFLACQGRAILPGLVGKRLLARCALLGVPNPARGGAPYGLIETELTDAGCRRQGHGRQVLQAATTEGVRRGCD